MKTKKVKQYAAIILLSMLSMPVFSQIKFGVKADVGLNNPEFKSSALTVENMTSYSVGPALEFMFPLSSVGVGVETALLYSDNRMTVSNLQNGTSSRDISNRYIKLPVNAKVKFALGGLPLKLYAAAGPYAAYLISGDKIDFEEASKDIKAKAFQAGANAGLGVEVFNMVQIGVNYRVLLTNNYAIDEPNWKDPLNGKNESWSITASVYF